RLVETLERHDAFDRVIVALIGIKHSLAQRIRRLYPRLETGHTAREIALFAVLSRLRLTCLFRPRGKTFEAPGRRYRQSVVTRRFVEDAHRKGISVAVWTINREAEMERYLAIGVD